MPTIRKPFEPSSHDGKISFPNPSRVQAEFKDSTKIDWYIRRYAQQGVSPVQAAQAAAPLAQYVDLSEETSDLALILSSADKVRAYFDGLPSDLRRHFGDGVQGFLRAVADPARVEELTSLGVFAKQVESTTSGVAAEPAATTSSAPAAPAATPAPAPAATAGAA